MKRMGQQLTVVGRLLLEAGGEGPSFISDTASCSCEHVLDTTPPESVRGGSVRAALPHTALTFVAALASCIRSRRLCFSS